MPPARPGGAWALNLPQRPGNPEHRACPESRSIGGTGPGLFPSAQANRSDDVGKLFAGPVVQCLGEYQVQAI